MNNGWKHVLLTLALLGAPPSHPLLAGQVPIVQTSWAVMGKDFLPAALNLIEQSEYELRWQPHAAAWQSPNRENNLRFTYLPQGFIAERRAPVGVNDNWKVALLIESCGDTFLLDTSKDGELEVTKNTATVSKAGLTMRFTNDKSGMRQDFLVARGPASGPLRLVLRAELDGVSMGFDEEGACMYFASEFEEVMRYADLHVWDADGKTLPAMFEPLSESRFAIVVDAQGARYPVTVDPLTFYWSTVGGQAGCKYGYSVAFGNFNMGNGDVVVGAPYYDSGSTDEGKVFVFYGGDQSIPTTPSWTCESDQVNAHFGWSVAAADVNGDSFDDVIVGSPDYCSRTQGSKEGKVFVWMGSNTGLGPNGNPMNADWSKAGGTDYASFGYSVASAGDVNGDFRADLIVGAPYNDIYHRGAVYVYYGSPTGPSSTANWTASGDNPNDEFGYSVASAGDVNGDGYADVIIGAPLYDHGQTDEGIALVWHGGSSGLTPNPGSPSNAARLLEKNQAGARFGHSVASAGDVNAGGYGWVIVGAPLYDNGQVNEGAVFVYSGSPSGIPATESWSAESNQANAQLGFSVSGTDLNYDGYSDVVAGAPYYDYAATVDGGGVFLWYGGSAGLGANGTPSNVDESFFDLASNGAHSGWSVATGSNLWYYLHPGLIIGAPDEIPAGKTNAMGSACVWSLRF